MFVFAESTEIVLQTEVKLKWDVVTSTQLFLFREYWVLFFL